MDATGREHVVVVIGAGGMGEAVARRLGAGRLVVLADASGDRRIRGANELRSGGIQAIQLRAAK